jgi:hypothetical protein
MTSEEAHNRLRAYGVPEAVFDVWLGHQSTSPFQYSYRAPCCEIAEQLEEDIPGLAGLVPLFESPDGDGVVGLLPHRNAFVEFYYEDGRDGDAAIKIMGIGWQQFAAQLLIDLEEAGMDDLYDEAVTVLQFRHGPQLRAIFDAEPYDPAALLRFRESLAES